MIDCELVLLQTCELVLLRSAWKNMKQAHHWMWTQCMWAMCTATELLRTSSWTMMKQSHDLFYRYAHREQRHMHAKFVKCCEPSSWLIVNSSCTELCAWRRSSWTTMKQAHRQWWSKLVICLKNWPHLVQSHMHAKLMNMNEASSRLTGNSL